MSEQEANEQRQAEASDPATSAQRLEALSADQEIRPLVAGNLSAPAHLLGRLATDQDERVRAQVASNPNTPWPTLEHLAWEFPQAFLHNPAGSLQLTGHPEQISRNGKFWEALLREASIPSLWWSWLMSDPTLHLNPALQLHIQYAGEIGHPYGVCQPGEERNVLDLVTLLTSAWTQRATFPDEQRANQTVSGEQVVKEHLQWLAHSAGPEIRRMVALNPQTPAEALQTLAQDTDEGVQSSVAQNRQAPAEALQTLAHNTKNKIRQVVAQNRQAPTEVLRTLAQDRENAVRRTVAGNVQTPTEVLQILAQDAENEVRQRVAWNPQTPTAVLQILAQDTEKEVRQQVAGNRRTPTEVLQILAQDTENKVRKAVAENVQAPAAVLQILAQDAENEVRLKVARNPQTPTEVLQILAQDTENEVRQQVAQHEQTPVDVLRILVWDTEKNVQRYAAENPQTPVDVLRTLAQDTETRVRVTVARNLQTPVDVLRTLAQDREKSVRVTVAGNPQAPGDILRTLAQDAEEEVRWLANLALRVDEETENVLRSERWRKDLSGVQVYRGRDPRHQLDQAAQRNVPNAVRPIILEAFAADWDESISNVDERYWEPIWVRIMAPFVSPIMLQRFASFASWQVRFLVALHEKTSWETRLRLCQDGNRSVRAMARAKVAQRREQRTD